ncbi:type II toxin-antitoxin system PrlF family antitoxin [Saccharospirillum sp. HFRX-1]|uniref:type II toxin-antitoxin system PrlF family antitoxin n=1 Tax=unclassified Saccharospirillum TaxID=2633430 RepID=UPI0037149A85
MGTSLEVESTLTDRFQTTVPSSVREALKLKKRDKIHYKLLPDGRVVLTKAVEEANDPVLGQFLHFLAQDMAAHPERIQAVNTGLVERIQVLVGDVNVDLDEPLSDDDE